MPGQQRQRPVGCRVQFEHGGLAPYQPRRGHRLVQLNAQVEHRPGNRAQAAHLLDPPCPQSGVCRVGQIRIGLLHARILIHLHRVIARTTSFDLHMIGQILAQARNRHPEDLILETAHQAKPLLHSGHRLQHQLGLNRGRTAEAHKNDQIVATFDFSVARRNHNRRRRQHGHRGGSRRTRVQRPDHPGKQPQGQRVRPVRQQHSTPARRLGPVRTAGMPQHLVHQAILQKTQLAPRPRLLLHRRQ